MKTSEYKAEKFASGKYQKCWMCGCLLTESEATVDHLRAKAHGGKNCAENYRIACKPCNGKRGDRPLTRAEWEKAKGDQRPKQRDFSALAAAIQRARQQA